MARLRDSCHGARDSRKLAHVFSCISVSLFIETNTERFVVMRARAGVSCGWRRSMEAKMDKNGGVRSPYCMSRRRGRGEGGCWYFHE